jgi:hypothetical protein
MLTPRLTLTVRDSISSGSISSFESLECHRRQGRSSLDPPTGYSAAEFVTEHNLSRQHQALTLHHMLWDIYAGILEPQLVIWTGSECCPFKQTFTVSLTLQLNDGWRS